MITGETGIVARKKWLNRLNIYRYHLKVADGLRMKGLANGR
jgi:hypothetical protein